MPANGRWDLLWRLKINWQICVVGKDTFLYEATAEYLYTNFINYSLQRIKKKLNSDFRFFFYYTSGRSGDWIPVGRDFPPVQTGPGAHPASSTRGTGSYPGVKYGGGVLLTTHPLLGQPSWKSRAIPLPTFWATTGPVTGTLYLLLMHVLKQLDVCVRKLVLDLHFVSLAITDVTTRFYVQ